MSELLEPNEPAGRLTGDEVTQLTGHLAALTASGLPLPSGLRALGEELPGRRLGPMLNRLAEQLEAGESLDQAIKGQGGRLPPHLRGLVLAGASASTRGLWATPYRWVARLVPRIPADRLTQWHDRFLRRLYPPEVVEATIRSGYAFHTLPAAWDEVLGRFDAVSMRFVQAPVLILNGERDPAFRSGEAEFARAHPDARIELVPRARHLVMPLGVV